MYDPKAPSSILALEPMRQRAVRGAVLRIAKWSMQDAAVAEHLVSDTLGE